MCNLTDVGPGQVQEVFAYIEKTDWNQIIQLGKLLPNVTIAFFLKQAWLFLFELQTNCQEKLFCSLLLPLNSF